MTGTYGIQLIGGYLIFENTSAVPHNTTILTLSNGAKQIINGGNIVRNSTNGYLITGAKIQTIGNLPPPIPC